MAPAIIRVGSIFRTRGVCLRRSPQNDEACLQLLYVSVSRPVRCTEIGEGALSLRGTPALARQALLVTELPFIESETNGDRCSVHRV